MLYNKNEKSMYTKKFFLFLIKNNILFLWKKIIDIRKKRKGLKNINIIPHNLKYIKSNYCQSNQNKEPFYKWLEILDGDP